MADGTVYIDTAIDASTLENGIKNTEKAIKSTEAKLDKLIEKQIRFIETGGNTDSKTFAGMEYDIEKTRTGLEGLRADLSRLKEAQAETQTFSGMLKRSIDLLKRSFQNLGPNIRTVAKSLPKMAGKAAINGFKKLGDSLKNIGKRMLGG